MQRLRFVIAGDSLYAANTGSPFSRKGVVSICNQHLSAKGQRAADIDTYDEFTDDLVDHIRDLRLKSYRDDSNLLLEHRNAEDETASDYSGRCLFELLQNGDDAMAPASADRTELIGAKGLGFKSVLELTDQPEIHSQDFHFGFDAAKSRALLDGVRHAELVGIFRIPHAAVPDGQVSKLLRDGFTTVIRLRLRDAAARALAETQLAALSPHFLLLAQHLDAAEIRSSALTRTISRSGPRGAVDGSTADLFVRDQGHRAARSSWRVWRETWPAADDQSKRLSIAVALPLSKGVPVSSSQQLPLHVFYPTDDALDVPFLVHASFELQHNRKHVRAGRNDKVMLDRLARLVGRIAIDIPPESTVAIFRDTVNAPKRTRPRTLLGLIRQRIGQAVLQAEFVPVLASEARRVTPAAARTSLPGLAKLLRADRTEVTERNICAPDLDPLLRDLERFGARPLDAADYSELVRHARCRTVHDCRTISDIVARGCLHSWTPEAVLQTLRRAPIWLTDTGRIRSLAGGTPLLLARPTDWPTWCPAEVLDPNLAEAIFPGGTIPAAWTNLLKGWLHYCRDDHLRQCIAPVLGSWSDRDWVIQGWSALRLVETWVAIEPWEKVKAFVPDGSDTLRNILADVMRVPSGKAWVPARACYASRDIGAAPGLARAFATVEGRYRCGRPAEAKQHFTPEKWRALLRFLGVSWEPKIQLFNRATGTSLPEPAGIGFIGTIRAKGLLHRTTDWYLEDFPAGLLRANVPPAGTMTMVESIVGAMEGRHGLYLKKSDGVPYNLQPWRTFVDHQLQTERFLTARPGIDGKRGPRDGGSVYWPRRGLRGITPELELGGLSEKQRDRLKPILLKALGAHDTLPDHWPAWRDWCKALADAVGAGREVSVRVVRDFYETLLNRKFLLPTAPAPDRLVCIVADAPFGLRTVPSTDAAWIDKPMLATPDVLNALAQAGLAYIPPLLDRGANAPFRLGLRRASSVVEVAVDFAQESDAETLKMGRLLSARWKAIAVQCEAKNVRPPPLPAIRAVRGLTLKLSVEGLFVSRIVAAAYQDGAEWLVGLDGDRYEALATALADGLSHGTDLRYRFAAVLRARSGQDVRRALQEDGIPAYRLDAAGLKDDDAAPLEPSTPEEPRESDDEPEGWPGASTPEPPPPTLPSPAPPADTPGPSEPAGTVYGTGRLKERPLYDPEPSTTGSGGSGGGWGGASQLGMEGEKWLEQRMRATMPPGADLVLHVRDEQRRESDLVLKMSGRSWHIEVKTLSSERFYWSGLEIEKAKLKKGAYWMCFLIREGWGFRTHWSWSPLDDLLVCERRMQWQWASEAQGPLLEPDSWMPADGVRSPERPPDRATAVIRILDGHLAGLARDGPELTAFWQRIRARDRG